MDPLVRDRHHPADSRRTWRTALQSFRNRHRFALVPRILSSLFGAGIGVPRPETLFETRWKGATATGRQRRTIGSTQSRAGTESPGEPRPRGDATSGATQGDPSDTSEQGAPTHPEEAKVAAETRPFPASRPRQLTPAGVLNSESSGTIGERPHDRWIPPKSPQRITISISRDR